MRRRPPFSRWPLLAAAVMLAAGGVAGCGSPAASGPARTATSDTGPSSTPASIPRTDADLVGSIDVRPSELPRGFGPKNLFGAAGDRVDGYVTMDLCGARFASENLRTARHQVGYRGPGDDEVSTEAVAYRAGGASLAMSELRRAIRTCPTGYIRSPELGAPPMKEHVEYLPRRAPWLPDTVAISVTFTLRDGARHHGDLVYQRQGDVIVGTYVYDGRLTSSVTRRLAPLMARRVRAAGPAADGSAA